MFRFCIECLREAPRDSQSHLPYMIVPVAASCWSNRLMLETPPSDGNHKASREDRDVSSSPPKAKAGTKVILVAVFFLASGVMSLYKPFTQAEAGDPALYDYMAQCIVRGEVPYRDVVDGKAPGSLYLSAVAMAAAKAIGFRDILGVRLMNVLLMGLLATSIFAVTEIYFRDRIAALIAVLVPLMSTRLSLLMIGGTQPKLATVLFGIVTLLLIAKDRPMLAGVCSMLSCLCWQPGLLFTGVAFLMFSRYLTSWRDLRALKVALGAAIPLAALLLYFYSRGALDDLWSWTITFNYSTYAPKLVRSFGDSVAHLWDMTTDVFRGDVVLIIMSVAGAALFAWERIRIKLRTNEWWSSPELFRDAILIPPVVYLAFTLISLQGPDDLIPFLPFAGIFAGVFISKIPALSALRRFRWVELVPIGAVVILLFLLFTRAVSYKNQPGSTLHDQEREFAIVGQLLGPNDEIYAHRGSELLVLLNRRNLNKYVLLDRGKDDYINATMPGGFKAVLDEMESRAPKIVSISHLGQVSRRDELRQWVEKHYDRLPMNSDYDHVYIRRSQ